MTFNSDTQNCDLEIRIDSAAGEKLLGALTFPLRMDFLAEPAAEQELETVEQELEISEEVAASAEDADGDRPESSEDGLEAIVQDVLNQPLIAHVSAVADEATDRERMEAKDENQAQLDTERAGQKRYDIQLQALSVIISTRPRVSPKKPLTLTEINLQLHAEIKVGMRAWGKKWYWKTMTTPWIEVAGREAKLKLSADGSRILAMPELENTDIAIALKLWKWHLRCKLGVSKIINRRLGKHGPFQLVDFSDFNHGSQFFGKNPQFIIQTISESGMSVVVKADIDWT